MKLKGRVTAITGAGCGNCMGRAFATAFAREGSDLVLNHFSQPPEGMAAFKKELEAIGARVALVEGDISKEETAVRFAVEALDAFGKVDVLMNCAGVTSPNLLVDMSLADWQHLIDVDLTSVFLTCHYIVPHMIERRFGRIINIASQLGQKGAVAHCHYTAAKAGVIAFTKSLAREVGQYGITANCIAPGPINTDMMSGMTDKWREEKVRELVVPRIGEMEEVTPTAILLASEPDGNLYTGQTLGPNQGDVML